MDPIVGLATPALAGAFNLETMVSAGLRALESVSRDKKAERLDELGNDGAENSGSVTSESGDSELLELVVGVLGLVSELFVDSSNESLIIDPLVIAVERIGASATHLERSEFNHGVCERRESAKVQNEASRFWKCDSVQGICRPQSEGRDLKRLCEEARSQQESKLSGVRITYAPAPSVATTFLSPSMDPLAKGGKVVCIRTLTVSSCNDEPW